MHYIVLVGIPGSGKSSVLHEIVRQIPSVQVVNYGDKMLEEAGGSRDMIRKMPFREQQQIGVRAAKKIVAQQTDGIAIIDTHALVRIDSGYCPGLPLQVLEILSPAAYALVECQPSIILERRMKDQGRRRDKETSEELLMHLELTRSFITSCCMYTGSLLCYVQNNSSEISANVLPLTRLIQSIYAEC